ncbi:MAG: peptidylprolyl isomerase [Thermodesulfobacteriota bacterium]|nr:peptidylprolyl isomerase [Thermodesulfobacteriota bacterium]
MSESNELTAVMETSKGTIRLRLFADQTPLTVANFVNLAQRNFYKNLRFHRVLQDFMIQGGCPLGTGTGEPGYRFEDEFVDSLQHDKPGVLSMANAGPGTNGSQFFITHVPTPWLNGNHTVFGEVVSEEDMAVVNSIVQGDMIKQVTIEGETSDLFEKTASRVEEWNKKIDQSFPELAS